MKKLKPSQWESLRKRLAPGELKLDETTLAAHSGDKWFATGLPDAVALPRTAEAVSTILRFAKRHGIPVTPRAGGVGYVGGCVPVHGGIALSVARMRRIREIHEDDFVAVVQPGVITGQLQEKVEARGLYYPPDPASRAECCIGGNIATNAGGPRSLKYGVTSDYVLGLQVVLPDGAIVRVGGRTHKNKTGFDFPRFFTGTEGLLAVITEATLKLLPLPPYRAALSIGLPSTRAALRVIRAIFKTGLLPSALEVADQFTLRAAQKRTGSKRFVGCKGHVIVELDGQESSVRTELRHLKKLVAGFRPRFVDQALGDEAVEGIWQLRREFSYALRDTGLKKLNEDIVVPRGQLEPLLAFTAQLQKKHDLPVACFGHAGDGNIHTNVMVDESAPSHAKRKLAALDELFAWVIAHGGVITGEHGVGMAKKRWWPQAADKNVRRLHTSVKAAIDPDGLMNPGKFV